MCNGEKAFKNLIKILITLHQIKLIATSMKTVFEFGSFFFFGEELP